MKAAFCAKRETRRGEEKIKLYLSLSLVSHFALVSRFEKMPRSPRLAHKAPVMQARIPLHIYKIGVIDLLERGETFITCN